MTTAFKASASAPASEQRQPCSPMCTHVSVSADLRLFTERARDDVTTKQQQSRPSSGSEPLTTSTDRESSAFIPSCAAHVTAHQRHTSSDARRAHVGLHMHARRGVRTVWSQSYLRP
uniref:Uncharacterized protein n=1 Tax=Knipowitschia caucasica TaxID=637954 RepID=A0AAV2L450_KNICA